MKNSELRYLKSLDNYSLSELKSIIKSLKFSQKIEEDKIYATWFDKNTLLTVLYDKEEKFIKIEKQSVSVSKWRLFLENIYEISMSSHRVRVIIVVILFILLFLYVILLKDKLTPFYYKKLSII